MFGFSLLTTLVCKHILFVRLSKIERKITWNLFHSPKIPFVRFWSYPYFASLPFHFSFAVAVKLLTANPSPPPLLLPPPLPLEKCLILYQAGRKIICFYLLSTFFFFFCDSFSRQILFDNILFRIQNDRQRSIVYHSQSNVSYILIFRTFDVDVIVINIDIFRE